MASRYLAETWSETSKECLKKNPSRVEDGEAADQARRLLPDLEDLVVHGDEERREVFGLREVVVEAVVEAVHDDGAHVRVLGGCSVVS